jgi:DNA-binding protein HU-beta
MAEKKITAKETKGIVNDFIESLSEKLIADGKVRIEGFGTFTLKETKERQGRNPQTGESITIKAGKKVLFKPSDVLKNKIK